MKRAGSIKPGDTIRLYFEGENATDGCQFEEYVGTDANGLWSRDITFPGRAIKQISYYPGDQE